MVWWPYQPSSSRHSGSSYPSDFPYRRREPPAALIRRPSTFSAHRRPFRPRRRPSYVRSPERTHSPPPTSHARQSDVSGVRRSLWRLLALASTAGSKMRFQLSDDETVMDLKVKKPKKVRKKDRTAGGMKSCMKSGAGTSRTSRFWSRLWSSRQKLCHTTSSRGRSLSMWRAIKERIAFGKRSTSGSLEGQSYETGPLTDTEMLVKSAELYGGKWAGWTAKLATSLAAHPQSWVDSLYDSSRRPPKTRWYHRKRRRQTGPLAAPLGARPGSAPVGPQPVDDTEESDSDAEARTIMALNQTMLDHTADEFRDENSGRSGRRSGKSVGFA